MVLLWIVLFSKKDFIYLFLERGEWREKEWKRNIDMREKHQLVASSTYPDLGRNLQPRHVPWSGIKLVTFCFAGRNPTNWPTLVRAMNRTFDVTSKKSLPNVWSERFTPIFFHKFYRFMFFTHFELNWVFCIWYEIWIKVLFLEYVYVTVTAQFVEKTILSPLHYHSLCLC